MKKILLATNFIWLMTLSIGLTCIFNAKAYAETYHISPDGFGGYNMTNNSWGGYDL